MKYTRSYLAATAMVLMGLLFLSVGIHDSVMPEDSAIVWVCSIDGNGTCGPNTPPILIEPSNLFLGWDLVGHEYFGTPLTPTYDTEYCTFDFQSNEYCLAATDN